MLNGKRNIIPIIKLVFKFASVVAVSQLLVSCSTSKIALLAVKDSEHNKRTGTKSASLPKKVSNEQIKSKKKSNGRAVVGRPYQIKGKWYYPKDDPAYKRVGQASWYGSYFHGRLTANGEVYDMNLLTAAHPTMPLPSYARVTNLENGSSLIVRVNDRGPFMKDRIIDLSKQAAMVLGYANAGIANVKVEYVSKAPVDYYDGAYLMASYTFGNHSSPLLTLADISGKREDVMLGKLNLNSQRKLIKSAIEQKHLSKIASIKLPEIGPILINKPTSFNQVAFVNK
ncbi:septal ring lytic transglycosylase RlpA family protein [Bartonella sp. B17]